MSLWAIYKKNSSRPVGVCTGDGWPSEIGEDEQFVRIDRFTFDYFVEHGCMPASDTAQLIAWLQEATSVVRVVLPKKASVLEVIGNESVIPSIEVEGVHLGYNRLTKTIFVVGDR